MDTVRIARHGNSKKRVQESLSPENIKSHNALMDRNIFSIRKSIVFPVPVREWETFAGCRDITVQTVSECEFPSFAQHPRSFARLNRKQSVFFVAWNQRLTILHETWFLISLSSPSIDQSI